MRSILVQYCKKRSDNSLKWKDVGSCLHVHVFLEFKYMFFCLQIHVFCSQVHVRIPAIFSLTFRNSADLLSFCPDMLRKPTPDCEIAHKHRMRESTARTDTNRCC